MFSFITSVFKYTALVIVILVLSHIIEIKGVSISHHVEHTLNWITGFSPSREATKLTRGLTSSIQERTQQLKKAEDDFTEEDQKKLNELIKKSQR